MSYTCRREQCFLACLATQLLRRPRAGRSYVDQYFSCFFCVHVLDLLLISVSETSGTPLGRNAVSAFGRSSQVSAKVELAFLYVSHVCGQFCVQRKRHSPAHRQVSGGVARDRYSYDGVGEGNMCLWLLCVRTVE